jgi:hypothetical protein
VSYPLKYTQLNTAPVKQLNVVVEIEGLPFYFSIIPTYKKIRYGDADLTYGDGAVYGGLRERTDVYPYLSTNSSLSISQKIEPEQGRGSASTMSFEFVDYEGFMTKVMSPGQYLDEPLGGKLLKVWLGYQNSSFKEDYFVVYRGYITGITSSPTKIMLQTTDSFYKLKQQCFLMPTTKVRPHEETFDPVNVDTVTGYFAIPGGNSYGLGMVLNFINPLGLPGGLAPATDYYVVTSNPGNFRISATYNGAVLVPSSGGTGTTTAVLKNTGPDSTFLPVYKTDGLTNKIIGPDGVIDAGLKTYVRVNDEFLEYQKDSFGTDFITVSRAGLGTVQTGHDVEAECVNVITIQGNIIDNSLKIMLSGWDGTWINNISLYSFNDTGDITLGIEANTICLPDTIDAVDDYGLATGDYLYITGSASNDGTYILDALGSARGYPNNLLFVQKVGGGGTVTENPTLGKMAIRSQFDVYPVNCGMQLRGVDVDVVTWQNNRSDFAGQADNEFLNLITQPQDAKSYIEKEYLLPSGGYGITRFGRISSQYTKPPLASESLQILNIDTIIEPQNIAIQRALNTRKFWNEVQYFLDYSFLNDDYTTLSDNLDTDSLNKTTVSQVLPIQARGLRTSLGADSFISRRAGYILRRYGPVAQEIKIKTNWRTASLIQAGDSVALYDNGELKLSNFATGERDLGYQLFEVIDWALDIKTGTASLTLLGSTGYQVSDRFATISPSSIVGTGSTINRVRITDSYGALYPNNESQKWAPLVGDKIAVRSADYTTYEETELIGIDPIDPYILILNPGLSFVPSAGMIVDCAEYPTSTDQAEQARSKLLFAFQDPSLSVVSGTSQTVFDVSPSDALILNIGLPVLVRANDWSYASVEAKVVSITSGTIVTVDTALGFTPAAGDIVELVGFKDLLGPYLTL